MLLSACAALPLLLLQDPAEPFGGRRFAAHPLRDEVLDAVADAGVEEATADLFARLARLAEQHDPARAAAVDLVMRDPWALRGLAEALVDGFAERALGDDPRALLERACAHAAWSLDLAADYAEHEPARRSALRGGLSPEEHLDQIEQRLAAAHALREHALAALDEAARARVVAGWRGLDGRFAESVYLFDDPDEARRAANADLIALGPAVDRAAMLAAAAALAPLADPEWLAALRADLEAAGLDLGRPVVLRRDTGWGTIAIGGTGDDWHRDEDLAVLIELGGDDFHGHNQGATANEEEKLPFGVAVLVDVSGDDAYESTHAGAQGAGVLGVGLLADLAGNDRYRAGRWAQGAGLMGVGLLLDAAGHDDYRAEMVAQGCGAWGAGLLLDLGGDDRYAGGLSNQAVGLAGGLGLLLERDGDDEYYLKGRDKTGYGTRGVWEGWGQGCGVGFRTQASGGLALLLDEDGADLYEGGNFTQGGGYFFGLGALEDRGRDDDTYIGSRYAQGFAAHQALGWFRETGGDDRYLTRNAVASGLAWDECVTMFIEEGGDDLYQGGGFSLGASAHNSLCVFWERRGDDVYQRGPLGRAGGNDYHGGTSLSYFLDEGRGKDAHGGEALDGSRRSAPEHGFFVDR
jgi:hypothetical protein